MTEERGRGEEEPTVVEALLPHWAAGAESGWSAGECWLQVRLSFPVRIVCGPSACGETAARPSAGAAELTKAGTRSHTRTFRVSRKNSANGPIFLAGRRRRRRLEEEGGARAEAPAALSSADTLAVSSTLATALNRRRWRKQSQPQLC